MTSRAKAKRDSYELPERPSDKAWKEFWASDKTQNRAYDMIYRKRIASMTQAHNLFELIWLAGYAAAQKSQPKDEK